MNLPDDYRVLFEGTTSHVHELQQMLGQAGIQCRTGPAATTGWGTKAWLAVAGPDVTKAMAAYERYQDAMVGDERALQSAKKVADFDAAETECPACGTRFATAGAQRCPDCGLRFS